MFVSVEARHLSPNRRARKAMRNPVGQVQNNAAPLALNEPQKKALG
jgi:hypothetical protein